MAKFLLTFWCLIILPAATFADDLFLLKIAGRDMLDKVMGTVDDAKGVIGNRFIVYLNANQYNQLLNFDVPLELVHEHCDLNRLYLIEEKTRRRNGDRLPFGPLYSEGVFHIAELDKSSIGILDKGDYYIIPLASRSMSFFYRSELYPEYIREEYPSDTLADLISQDSLYSYVNRLESFYTRFTPTDSCIASAHWIKGKFQSLGYSDLTLHSFHVTREYMNIYNEPAYNVICCKEGTVKPDIWIVIGGHYDSYNGECLTNPNAPAPGADDDASGVAAALELARIFESLDLRKSFMFVAFGGEEQWMQGSDSLARELHEDSVNIEFMLNMDMIAYEPNPDFQIDAYTTGNGYYDVFAAAASRVTDVTANYYLHAMWDAGPFVGYGAYAITLHENQFNDPHYHTRHDSSAYLNFPYFEDNVRMAAAALAVIDASGEPVACNLYDPGDGQSLRSVWDSCFDDYTYRIVYGTNQNNLGDTIDVPPFSCFCDIVGLTEGQQYYVAVLGTPEGGYPPLSLLASREEPLIVPRRPTGLTAEPDSACIVLSWDAGIELDLDHYKILRKKFNQDWLELPENATGNMYIDTAVESAQFCQYRIIAVDNDLNESDTSDIAVSYPATFDQGILLVDETQAGNGNPSESEQTVFYDAMFSGYGYTGVRIDSADDALARHVAGMYNPLFWVDDDDYQKLLEGSLDSLKWFLTYDTDFLLAGWQTIYSITGQKYFYPGGFYYDELGISYIAQNPLTDFSGPDAVGDWPVLELKPDAPGGARMPDIDVFTAAPGAQVIYTFNSYSSHPFYDGRPVGVAYDTYHGKRVILGFPLYWLTEESAQALIEGVMDYFAQESIAPYGDVNHDFAVNILDITFLISYLYQGGPSPPDMDYGDPNGDCNINILDITYLIGYLYKGGPQPVEGCVY